MEQPLFVEENAAVSIYVHTLLAMPDRVTRIVNFLRHLRTSSRSENVAIFITDRVRVALCAAKPLNATLGTHTYNVYVSHISGNNSCRIYTYVCVHIQQIVNLCAKVHYIYVYLFLCYQQGMLGFDSVDMYCTHTYQNVCMYDECPPTREPGQVN